MCFGKIPVACCVLLVTRCGSVCVLARFSVYQLSLLPVACCVLLVTRCGSACFLAIVPKVITDDASNRIQNVSSNDNGEVRGVVTRQPLRSYLNQVLTLSVPCDFINIM